MNNSSTYRNCLECTRKCEKCTLIKPLCKVNVWKNLLYSQTLWVEERLLKNPKLYPYSRMTWRAKWLCHRPTMISTQQSHSIQ
nr:MAG TPA: hypothetical protein [Caudoviricetes sp.]